MRYLIYFSDLEQPVGIYDFDSLLPLLRGNCDLKVFLLDSLPELLDLYLFDSQLFGSSLYYSWYDVLYDYDYEIYAINRLGFEVFLTEDPFYTLERYGYDSLQCRLYEIS